MNIKVLFALVVGALALLIVSPTQIHAETQFADLLGREKADAAMAVYSGALLVPGTSLDYHTVKAPREDEPKEEVYVETVLRERDRIYTVALRQFHHSQGRLIPVGMITVIEKGIGGLSTITVLADVNVRGVVTMAKRATGPEMGLPVSLDLVEAFDPFTDEYLSLQSQDKITTWRKWQREYDQILDELRALIKTKIAAPLERL
jgi:hypothetical protein